ncbi:helix-turn-helix domain-containing protein [Ramlibacter sp. 2FC]|uniref:helix-turn-helix domain-containing protein n=1 Tax=Ramlibacter sp. 2FC TaxID=2502188 RepID=UPI0010F8BF2F|nr:helix-turn-helix domain-containing protein [Ramlibacter sp. 2FC]
MSEGSEGSASADGVLAGPTAGALVRQAREAAGLQVDALAAALKVTVKQVEALEADRWDLLPDAVFARALAATVCRNLKIDAAPVLARLPQTAPRLSPRGQLNEPFKAPQHRASPDVGAYLSRPLVLGVLALLLGALVLVLMPVPKDEAPPASTAAPSEQAQAAPQGAAPAAGGGMVTELLLPPAATAASAAAPIPAPTALPAAAPASTSAMTTPMAPAVVAPSPVVTTPVVATPQAPASAAAAPAGLLQFGASADSWIKVTDARGTVVLSRLLKAGESAGASGQLPLSVVVGRADATRVQLRGQPMDLAPITRDNVARFEVK